MTYPDFITTDDFDASIHAEILDNIIRNDRNLLNIATDRAITEMISYLSGLYDTVAIFSASGSSRNPLLVMFCIDIILYHLHSVHNPRALPQIRVDRYNRAIEWLAASRDSRYGSSGLPLKPVIESTTYRNNTPSFGSNTKNQNHW